MFAGVFSVILIDHESSSCLPWLYKNPSSPRTRKGVSSWCHLVSINEIIDPHCVRYRALPWKLHRHITWVLCFFPDSQATFSTDAPGKICSLLIFLLLRSAVCLLLLLFVIVLVLLATV